LGIILYGEFSVILNPLLSSSVLKKEVVLTVSALTSPDDCGFHLSD